MKKNLFLLAILLIISTFSGIANENEGTGDNGSIIGRVVDEDNLPLPGASVIIEGENNGVATDANGFYRISFVKPGEHKLKISYIGFNGISKTITTAKKQITKLDFKLTPGVAIKTVVVTGAMQGQSKAFNQQKNNINVCNVISADQVGRFPDQNIGDALKRVPGINVQYDQGEARFGNIRGTAPEYSSVQIDGDRIPSAEAESRSIQLDLIPSDMIQSVEVNKVVTADMDGDAIGGSVNLVTKSNPYSRRISGSFGGTYNALRQATAPNFSLLYGDRFFNKKFGMTLSASIQDHIMGSDDMEAEWTKNDNDETIMADLDVRTYEIERLRQSYSANFDYEFNNNNKIEFKAMYNHRNDWENRYRVEYKDLDEDQAKIQRQIKGGTHKNARLEDQRTIHLALNGEHQLGNLGIKWSASYSKANEDRPNERYLRYKIKKVDFTQDISNPREPHVTINTEEAQDFNDSWSFDELTEEHQYTEDIDKKFKVDFKLPLENKTSVLRFGAKYKSKSKDRDNDFYYYTPTDEDTFNENTFANTIVKTKSNYLAGDYTAGTYPTVKYLSRLELQNSDSFDKELSNEDLAGNFDATENIAAGYIRFDQKLGKSLDLVAGVRIENTNIKYSGEIYSADDDELTDSEEEKHNYTNLLPSLLLKYKLDKNTNLKASVTNTLARPKYYDLVPHVEIKEEDNELEIGNPDLKATTSWNFDLMAEHYFKSIGIVSAGLYYKEINDWIVDYNQSNYTYNGTVYDKCTMPMNAGDASLFGIELALQRQFDFLPGILKQTGFYANYTYNHSKTKNITLEDRDEDLPLEGTPEHSFNASLFYEGKHLSARVSFNYASDFIDEIASDASEDIYYDQVSYLDFNTNYKFNKKVMIYAEVNNILNTPLRYYQGESQYTYQAEYYNVKVNLGMKFNF